MVENIFILYYKILFYFSTIQNMHIYVKQVLQKIRTFHVLGTVPTEFLHAHGVYMLIVCSFLVISPISIIRLFSNFLYYFYIHGSEKFVILIGNCLLLLQWSKYKFIFPVTFHSIQHIFRLMFCPILFISLKKFSGPTICIIILIILFGS